MKTTKEHILKVSFGLFLQKSYKEVTMKEIVEKTGLSKGAFYHYFDSKEQVFMEIIHYAFDSALYMDFSQFSRASLYEFYHDYLSYMDRMYASFQNTVESDESFDWNYYSLIFDAIRLFPEFKDTLIENNDAELGAWTQVIHNAKLQGEIRSPMEDAQIANVFFLTNSGVGMNNIMSGKTEETTRDLRAIWDSFYAQLKG